MALILLGMAEALCLLRVPRLLWIAIALEIPTSAVLAAQAALGLAHSRSVRRPPWLSRFEP